MRNSHLFAGVGVIAAAAVLVAYMGGQQANAPVPPAQSAAGELSPSRYLADVTYLASDALKGRGNGSPELDQAADYIAGKFKDAGLQPAGDNGTYFQFFPLERLRVSASSTVTLGGTSLRMGREVIADTAVLATVDAPIVIVAAESIPAGPAPVQAPPAAAAPAPPAPAALPDVKGKVVVVRYPVPAGQGNALRTWIRG